MNSYKIYIFQFVKISVTYRQNQFCLLQDMFQGPAEVMSHLLEGKNKETCGTTYAALKAKLLEIAKSGYFDNAQPEPVVSVISIFISLVIYSILCINCKQFNKYKLLRIIFTFIMIKYFHRSQSLKKYSKQWSLL